MNKAGRSPLQFTSTCCGNQARIVGLRLVATNPMTPKPANNIAYVPGSGIAVTFDASNALAFVLLNKSEVMVSPMIEKFT